MKTNPHLARSGSRRIRLLAILGVAAIVALLAGGVAATSFNFGQTGPVRVPGTSTDAAPGASPEQDLIGIRTFVPPDGITVISDVVYRTQPDGTPLRLDVCSPAGATEGTALPAIVSVHGGSWTRGDKATDDWRTVCQWLASEGFVALSVDYRLAPAHPFPAGIDDLAAAVEWIRQPDHARKYGIDPARIGAFGGSAGANLAALLGTRGSGPTSAGFRVAAVAELSGPSELTGPTLDRDGSSERLNKLVRNYLGCSALAECPQAAAASPTLQLDRSDPPVFIGNSENEFVPLAQAQRFAAGLDRLGIPYELVTVPGNTHSIGLLDAAMRVKVAAFLHRALGDESLPHRPGDSGAGTAAADAPGKFRRSAGQLGGERRPFRFGNAFAREGDGDARSRPTRMVAHGHGHGRHPLRDLAVLLGEPIAAHPLQQPPQLTGGARALPVTGRERGRVGV